MEDRRREEITDFLVKSDLIHKCVKYQTNKSSNAELKKDLEQECWTWILEYDIEKAYSAYTGNHLNALITRYLTNQFHSRTSKFYKDYLRFDLLSDEITDRELNIPDG